MIDRTLMADIGYPVTIRIDVPNTYADVLFPGTINNDLPNTYVWYLVPSYYKQWSTENLCLIFAVPVLYTVMYRTPVADVWCAGTKNNDLPNSYGWYLISSLLYAMMYRKPMADVWCPLTLNSDLPITHVLYLVSRYYTQWCTENLWLMFGAQFL